MNSESRRALFLAVVALLLLGNHLYVYPEGVSSETTLTYEATATDRIPEGLPTLDAEIRSCSWFPMQSWECAVFRDVADGDPVEYPLRPDETVGETLFGVDYVRTPGGYHRPTHRIENGTLVLSADPVDRETVRGAAAENVTDARPFVRRAVENGSATVRESELYETASYFVRDGGTYYLVEPTESVERVTGWGWRDPPRLFVQALRLGGWIGGVALLVRAGEWSERGRRTAESSRGGR